MIAAIAALLQFGKPFDGVVVSLRPGARDFARLFALINLFARIINRRASRYVAELFGHKGEHRLKHCWGCCVMV